MTGRVVVVDDHDEFCRAASDLLSTAGWDVVATAHDADSALVAVRRHHPDLVLLDVSLAPGGADGIDVAHELAALAAPPAVILVSARSAASYGSRLTGAPMRGFVPKPELTGAVVARLVS